MKDSATLGEIVEINPPLPRECYVDPNQKVSFIPMAGLSEQGCIIKVEDRFLADVKQGYTEFLAGDVLVAKITPCMENGKAALVPELPHSVGFGSTEFHVLRPTPKVDSRYLFYSVWNARFRREAGRNMTGTAGQKRVPATFLERYRIPLPALDEQRRIAAILDKADAIRRKRQDILKVADTLAQSAFLELFGDPEKNVRGWKTVTLDSLCSRITDGTHQPPEWSPAGVPFIFVSNVRNNEISLETKKFISMETWRSLMLRCPVEAGDILYTTVGSYGNAALVEEPVPFAFQRHIAHIKPNHEKVVPSFLLSMLQSPGVRHQVDRHVRGVAQKTLNLRELAALKVFSPPHPAQMKYLKTQRNIAAFRRRIQESAHEGEELLQSLYQSFGREGR